MLTDKTKQLSIVDQYQGLLMTILCFRSVLTDKTKQLSIVDQYQGLLMTILCFRSVLTHNTLDNCALQFNVRVHLSITFSTINLC